MHACYSAQASLLHSPPYMQCEYVSMPEPYIHGETVSVTVAPTAICICSGADTALTLSPGALSVTEAANDGVRTLSHAVASSSDVPIIVAPRVHFSSCCCSSYGLVRCYSGRKPSDNIAL